MKSPISLLSARVKCSSSVTSQDSSLESSYSESYFRKTQRSHLLRYSNNHEHEGETFQCQGCDFKTTQWASYMTHIKSHQHLSEYIKLKSNTNHNYINLDQHPSIYIYIYIKLYQTNISTYQKLLIISKFENNVEQCQNQDIIK